MAFTFRIRARERDQAADQARFEQMADTIRKTRADILRESEGLRARCEKARCSASFAMEAIEADEKDAAMEERIRTLSDTILTCEERLAALDQQALFLDAQRLQILEFASKLTAVNRP